MQNNLKQFISEMSDRWDKATLPIPLGRDDDGKLHLADLSQTGNIIIGGSTGSGKSMFNHNLICSLILKYDSTKLRLFLADPKVVEFPTTYKQLPHVLEKVYTHPEEIIERLSELKKEILNKEYLYLVIVIDTFSDLMMYDSDRFESVISDLSKLNNKGVYIIICDSRPSVDVFTDSLMKFFPTKIAFNLSSEIDSKRVIGIAGAEKLLGRGDMLYLQKGEENPIRLQVPYISDEDIKESVGQDLFEKAKKVASEYNWLPAQVLQMSLMIGHAKAQMLLNELEKAGIVGPDIDGKPRKVLKN